MLEINQSGTYKRAEIWQRLNSADHHLPNAEAKKMKRGGRLSDLDSFFIEFQQVEYIDKTGHPRV